MGIYSKLDRPIEIVNYNSHWIYLFENEKLIIKDALENYVISIEHIGSTAIPDLAAKPVIDIALGINNFEESKKLIPIIEKLGYNYEPEFEKALPNRRFFWKGTKENHTFHIHMAEVDSELWEKPIIFRDYLRKNPNEARRYGLLKKSLASRCGNDIECYINGKTEFIENILRKISGKY